MSVPLPPMPFACLFQGALFWLMWREGRQVVCLAIRPPVCAPSHAFGLAPLVSSVRLALRTEVCLCVRALFGSAHGETEPFGRARLWCVWRRGARRPPGGDKVPDETAASHPVVTLCFARARVCVPTLDASWRCKGVGGRRVRDAATALSDPGARRTAQRARRGGWCGYPILVPPRAGTPRRRRLRLHVGLAGK